MKQLFLSLLITFSSMPLLAQEERRYAEDETEEEVPVSTREIGFDVNFSATNFGGSGGLGVKLGFIQGEKFILGPSIRYQQSWSNINGVKTGFSVYGGGAFAHVRLANYFFVGTEIEVLSTPIVNGYVTSQRSWVPTALFGGGFSRAFTPNFRLNAGIMYDVINHTNSPLRPGYFMKKNTANSSNVNGGAYIPILYRIAFFFPI